MCRPWHHAPSAGRIGRAPQLARPAKTKADPSARMRGNVAIEPTVV